MSVLSFVVNVGTTVLLHERLKASAELAYAVALILVFVMNFLISRYIVFRAASGDATRQGLLFFVSSLSFRGVEYLLFLLIHTILDVWYVAAIICISIPMTLVKFVFHGKVVFVPKGKGREQGAEGKG
ncbi:MAG: GtrA family protein [Kiritimatiellae bacterium]|nr:GtrA family protein [Kiritimatiellia bacterium]